MTEKQKRVFFELHFDLPREGPVSRRSTERAFHRVRGLPERPRILEHRALCGSTARREEAHAGDREGRVQQESGHQEVEG